MHPDYERAHRISKHVIGAAIEVHRDKGPGLLESIYEKCLGRELTLIGLHFETQLAVPISYKGYRFDETLRLDLYVDRCLLVEVKAVQEILPIHKAQLLSYMKLLNAPLGLLINFNELALRNGISRLILAGADRP